MSARRLLWRWTARSLVTDRSQYRAILALIAAAATLSVVGVFAAYNLVTPPENGYGTADVIASTTGDPSPVLQALTDQGHSFGVVSRLEVPIPGSVQRQQLRFQDPDNPVTGPLLTLIDGRWPGGDDEIAVTDGGIVAPLGGAGPTTEIESTTVGEQVDVAGVGYTVVGIIENPTDLTDEFILVADMDAARQRFEIPAEAAANEFLIDAPPRSVTIPAGSGRVSLSSRSSVVDARTGAALAVNGITAIAMVEVALLAGAGFAVLARRRSRQYGLLAAAGASPSQLRTAATVGGTIVGVVGAAVGIIIGLGLALVITPSLESSVDHRIGFDLFSPGVWWAVLPTFAMATVAASVAARWPARPLSRQPVAHLLAALRPQPAPVGRATAAGLVMTATGAGAITYGFTTLSTLPAVIGIVAAPVGLLLLSPLLVRAIGRWSTAMPMPIRLGGRAVARHNRRSAAVVAALAIALGIPAAAVVVTASLDGYDLTKAPNLSERSAIVWQPGTEQPIPHIPASLVPTSPEGADPDDSPQTAAAADVEQRLSAAMPTASVTPIKVAVQPDGPREQENFDRIGSVSSIIPVFGLEPGDDSCLSCDVYAFGEFDENGDEVLYIGTESWIATPELLAAADIPDPPDGIAVVSRSSEIVLATNENGPLFLDEDQVRIEPAIPADTSFAPVLITEETVNERELMAVTIGWWITGEDPLTPEDHDNIAAASGQSLFAEFRDEPQPRSTTRTVAVAAGLIAGLGIALAAVSLFGGESADDLRILESIGADPGTARRMSAAVALALAACGAVIAVLIGYLALLPMLTIEDIDFPFVVPWPGLLALLILFPLLAAGAAMLTGPERASLTRSLPSLAGLSPVALLAVAVFSTACVPGQDVSTNDPSSPENTTELSPSELADTCDPDMSSALEAWVDQGYAGSITVLGGDRQCAMGLGPANRETGEPVTAETTFSIGSITKAVTAAAILDLADQGVIDVEDTVGLHVNGLEGDVEDLTIRNLLTHSSGLTGYHGEDHVAMTEAEATAAISDLPLSFEQGRGYGYTNAGYTLLALVVEAVTEQGFRRYVTEEILIDENGSPVGGFWDGEPAAPEPRAVGYLAGGVAGHQGDFDGPHWSLDGNGGVAMTGLEMAAWTRALFTGGILSPDATEQLTAIKKRIDTETSELPGWVELHPQILGEPAITASGGGGSIGHHMDTLWLPDSERVIVVAQSATSRNVGNLLLNIADAVVAGTGIPTPPAVLEAEPELLEQMVGTYRPSPTADEHDVIDVRIDPEDPRGLLVTATGPQAMAAVFPLDPGFVDEVARHEENALAVANGDTTEGARLRAAFEAENGPIDDVRIVSSVFDGELVTYLEATIGGHTSLIAMALDANGGTQAVGVDVDPPSRWFVLQQSGAFGMHGPQPEDVPIALSPTDDGLEIMGPDGSVTARRVGPADPSAAGLAPPSDPESPSDSESSSESESESKSESEGQDG